MDKNLDKLYLRILCVLLYKWMVKSACYRSSQWTSHLKGNEQLDVILCSLPPYQNVLSRIFYVQSFLFAQVALLETSVWKKDLRSENITKH